MNPGHELLFQRPVLRTTASSPHTLAVARLLRFLTGSLSSCHARQSPTHTPTTSTGTKPKPLCQVCRVRQSKTVTYNNNEHSLASRFPRDRNLGAQGSCEG